MRIFRFSTPLLALLFAVVCETLFLALAFAPKIPSVLDGFLTAFFSPALSLATHFVSVNLDTGAGYTLFVSTLCLLSLIQLFFLFWVSIGLCRYFLQRRA
jgi:hypothetical protein